MANDKMLLFLSKTQHLDEISGTVSEYADAVYTLTLKVRIPISPVFFSN